MDTEVEEKLRKDCEQIQLEESKMKFNKYKDLLDRLSRKNIKSAEEDRLIREQIEKA